MTDTARWMGCDIGEFSFTYLGLPIGENMRRVNAWTIVLEKFNKRLADWKAKRMSFGGRLTLVKWVLGSLPLYYFSMFRVPLSVLKNLESIRNTFFWGWSGDGKKISWVKWDLLLSSFGAGGLNIWSLRAKNLALLGKWWWRFRKEEGAYGLVVKSIYGICGGLGDIKAMGRVSRGGVWSEIVKIGGEIDGLRLKPWKKEINTAPNATKTVTHVTPGVVARKERKKEQRQGCLCEERDRSHYRLTYEDYQLFLKHFSEKGNSEGTKLVANMTHKEDEEDEWIFDSSCTEYITYLSDIRVNKKATHFEALVVIPNGDSILVNRKGDYILHGGTKVNGVLYVPDFKCNIFFVSRLSRDL
ncbi:hypothetical protein Tco_1163962 [Tanacetum coccineum]